MSASPPQYPTAAFASGITAFRGNRYGFGTFFQGTHVSEDQTELSIDVFQAAHGDVDGDRVVGTEDIVVIKTSDHGFAKPGPATWLDGDIIGHGLDTPPDGIVDLWDIFAIKRAGLYGEGQYAPDAPGGNLLSASAVPEPGTFVLLAIALVGLLVWRRR